MNTRSALLYRPDGTTLPVTLDKPVLKIGRAEDNDLILIDAARSVSRWHASITNNPGEAPTVSDLNSANGTTLNGHPVQGATVLSHGDSIGIGQFRLVYREESETLPYTIRTSAVDLGELQQDPKLLALSGRQEPANTAELRNLEVLFEVGITLARSHSVEEVTSVAVDLLFKIEQVHRAAVMLWNEEQSSFGNPELHFRGGRKVDSGVGPYDPRKLVMSQTILNRVREENRPLLIRDTKTEAMLSSAKSIVSAGIQAAFCSPLSYQGRFLGILYADNLSETQAFSETDFRTFSAIAAQTGLALANAIAAKELLRREVHREALKAYLPPQVADLILSSEGSANLAGTLQEITVLFADIRGFTRISEYMDAREVVHMLSEFFTVMSQVIFEHGGTVDKFIGDCIMALFGAPVASPQSADDALRAAVAMQQAAHRLSAHRSSLGLRETRIGIGLHTGPAVVGNIGSADRVQYTAIGDTVNVASRLVSRAEPNQIIVSEAFRQALSQADSLEFLGEVELKGRQNKLSIYSVRNQGAAANSNG